VPKADRIAVVQRLAVIERVGPRDRLPDERRQEDHAERHAEPVVANETPHR
jgi:hypothetical protein